MFNYDLKLVDSSRKLADILVHDIDKSEKKFSEMINLAFQDKYPLSMRAARVVALCCEKNRYLLEPYLILIIDSLEKFRVNGVRREFMKLIVEWPNKLNDNSIGKITELAFNWLVDTKQPIAVRYYSIEVLIKVADIYPEIAIELMEILNGLIENGSSGLKAKSKKVLMYLKHLKTLP
jgi:hypothetical protein